MSERQQILSRIQPKLIAFGLPMTDIQEVMTRLAMTEITVLRDIERDGLRQIAERVSQLEAERQGKGEKCGSKS